MATMGKKGNMEYALDRRQFLRTMAAGFFAAPLCGVAQARQKPNVLFIAVDDLRPALGCYGDETAVTPNIDALARKGVLFQRAYCQQAVCSPSRLSLITGRRPDTIRVWDLATHFRNTMPDLVTLPQHFKQHAVWLAGFEVAFNNAAGWLRGLSGDTGQLQGRAVKHTGVQRAMGQ